MSKKEALKEIRRRGRDIINVGLADEIAKAFGFDSARELGVVQQREAGANWQTREEVYSTGPSVGVYQLALAIARRKGLEVPSSPYMGTGKSAEFYSFQAAKLLEEQETDAELENAEIK